MLGLKRIAATAQFDDGRACALQLSRPFSEGSISLHEGYAKPLDGPREVGSGMVREEHVSLSRLIDIINQRFGGELNEADQLFFDQIAEAATRALIADTADAVVKLVGSYNSMTATDGIITLG